LYCFYLKGDASMSSHQLAVLASLIYALKHDKVLKHRTGRQNEKCEHSEHSELSELSCQVASEESSLSSLCSLCPHFSFCRPVRCF
jgi:hypothetical protein